MRPWIPYAAGLATAAAIAAVGGVVVVETGAFDVRASTPHSAFVAWAAHTTMIHAAAHGAASIQPPANFTPAEVIEGFRQYDEDCVACHGAPGVGRARWTDGLTPSPPYLVDAPRHWTKSELYWIVSNGVKMTAMPAWQDARSSRQIWDIVAFLEAQPFLTAPDYARLRERFPAKPEAPPLAK